MPGTAKSVAIIVAQWPQFCHMDRLIRPHHCREDLRLLTMRILSSLSTKPPPIYINFPNQSSQASHTKHKLAGSTEIKTKRWLPVWRVAIFSPALPKMRAGGRQQTEKWAVQSVCNCWNFRGVRRRHQEVTRALAHDCSVNYSTAPRPKRRGFKLEKNSRKGCGRLVNKTFWLHAHDLCNGPLLMDTCIETNFEWKQSFWHWGIFQVYTWYTSM
jgi:hypothetical protein